MLMVQVLEMKWERVKAMSSVLATVEVLEIELE